MPLATGQVQKGLDPEPVPQTTEDTTKLSCLSEKVILNHTLMPVTKNYPSRTNIGTHVNPACTVYITAKLSRSTTYTINRS